MIVVVDLHAQLRAGKEAEGQLFVYPVPFLERNGADGFWYNLVQCSVLSVTQELTGWFSNDYLPVTGRSAL